MGREPLHERRPADHRCTARRKPAFAGVDPYNFYIDRNSDDNVKDVTAAS